MSPFRLFNRFAPRAQSPISYPSSTSGLHRSGSMSACALATISAILLIFAAASMNATFAWQLGLAEGTFRAAVLAGASIGAAILAPLSFVAVTVALRRWQFGTALLALVPGLGCVSYTAASSLGFIASSRDAGIGAQLAISENRDDIRARREAALAELRLLKGQAPRILERRRALMADLAELSKERQAQPHQHQPDSQAKALAFYLTAAGYPVTTEPSACGSAWR